MINVEKKSIKTIDDYRHSIKLLKYHLKKQQKTNQQLKFEEAKLRHKPDQTKAQKHKVYSLNDTVKAVSSRLKRMGLLLQDVFRMADTTYEGQINKEQFMKILHNLKTNIDESLFTEMFYAIDTSLNGLISEEQFLQFSIAYGGSTNSKEIRKFEGKTKSKLGNLIQKKYGSIDNFLQKFPEPLSIRTFQKEMRELGLTENQTMLMMKTFDPSMQGKINHKTFSSLMSKVKFKSETEQKEEEYEKGIQELCAYWRDHKMNPIVIFEEADVDGKDGISTFELQQAFKKLMPAETKFQIKKWVSMINLNNDNEITKQQFLNSIRSFYSLNQMSKFSDEYTKLHPELAIKEEQSIEDIMKELSIKIEDSGMTKTQTFHFMDFNKNGEISKEEMTEGLKRMGMKIGFVGRVISVFDRDSSEQVSLKEWLRVLGEDIQLSQVPVADDLDSFFESQQGEKAKVEQVKKPEKKKPEKKKPESSKDTKGNKTIENKTMPKKQSTNKTTKPEIKKSKKEQPSKKSIIDKKFKEDEFKENTTKDNNKTVKKQSKIQKKPIKPAPPKKVINQKPLKPQPESQSDGQVFGEVNIDEIEEEVAGFYKKNKKKARGQFERYDSKKNGELKLQNFRQALLSLCKKANIDIQQTQANEIFGKYCINGEIIQYKNWLSEISDMYAQNISSGPEEVQEIPKEEDAKPAPKLQEKKIESKEDVEDNYNEQFDENEESREEVEKKPVLDTNLIFKNTVQKVAPKSKRGCQIKDFTQLLTLTIPDGQKTDSGYKLLNYIDNDGNNLKQIRDEKIKNFEVLKKKSKRFQDKTFPPTKDSLKSGKKENRIPNFTLIKWKHYTEIFDHPKLISGTIEPNDIQQGNFGHCYFLCSLACLSEYANMIERLFEFVDMETGYFLIWLCVDGEWNLIEIDGYIPIDQQGQPAFSRTSQSQLWVMLLQKAYAKAYGCYNNIVGGQPYEAIKDMSGAPGINYYLDKIQTNDLWQKLVQANDQKFLMTAGTAADQKGIKMDGRQEGVTSQGIVLGHAYSILDCQKINKQRIILLRNPWGDVEWKGSWSDSKWTSQMKKKLNYQSSQNDGIFWMTIEDFYKNFLMAAINILKPKYYYDSSIQNSIKQIAVKLNASEFQHGFIMANRKDQRHKGQSGQPYPIMSMMGLFVSNDGTILKKIKEKKFMYEREGMLEFNNTQKYPAGSQAVALIFVDSSCDLIVGYYGDKKIQFEIDNKCMKYIEQIAISDEDNETSMISGPLKCWLSEVQGLGFLMIKNISDNEFVLEVTIKSPQNLKLLDTQPVNKKKLKKGELFVAKGRKIEMNQGFNFCQGIQISS